MLFARLALLPILSSYATGQLLEFQGLYAGGTRSDDKLSKYITSDAPTDGEKARNIAEKVGAYLVTINTNEENAFVASLTRGLLWNGLQVRHKIFPVGCPGFPTDPLPDLRWDSGQPVAFTAWAVGNPNNCLGIETRVNVNDGSGGIGRWNDVPDSRELAHPAIEVELGTLRIHNHPSSTASPRSQYLFIQGEGIPNSQFRVNVLDEELIEINQTEGTVGPDGLWEKVVKITEKGRVLLLRSGSESQSSDILILQPKLTQHFDGPDFEKLQRGDVFLSKGSGLGPATQSQLHGGRYTHAWIFVGGAKDGTPEVVEAFGLFATSKILPLDEEALLCDRIDIYRYRNGLSAEQKNSIALASKKLLNVPYFSLSDFALVAIVDFYLGGAKHFTAEGDLGAAAECALAASNAASKLNSITTSTERVICSTLVWHIYTSAIGVDLATNNTITSTTWFSKLYGGETLSFLVDRKALILPDTLSLSDKLTFIDGGDIVQ